MNNSLFNAPAMFCLLPLHERQAVGCLKLPALKFMFSEKATKIEENTNFNTTLSQKYGDP